MTPPNIQTEVNKEVLCFCKGTTRAEFSAMVAEQPQASLADICQNTDIGLICTSCLLNAEALYSRVRQDGPATGISTSRSGARRSQDRVAWRQRLANLANKLPRVPRTRYSLAPILAGHGIRTILNVSNAIPRTIGAQSSSFRVSVVVRDARGRIRTRISDKVHPDDRFEADLSAALEPAGNSGNMPTTGVARIALRPLNDGYNGMVRPHFQLITRHSSAAVHTANAASHSVRPHLFSQRRSAERQFVHVHNAENKPGTATIVLNRVDRPGEERTIECALQPFGSDLIEMPTHEFLDGSSDDKILSVRVNATMIQRSYFIVADAAFSRVSVDHI